MIIRDYREEDLEFVLNEIPSKDIDGRRTKFIRVENCSDYHCLVAENDIKILGFIIMEDLDDGGSQYLAQINAFPKRQGTGRLLMEAAIDKLSAGGHICLKTGTNNEAQFFYEKLGFKQNGSVFDYRTGKEKYWYVFDINESTCKHARTQS